jgi:carbon storage regulator
MLILSRVDGQSIQIGEHITVTILGRKGAQTRVGIAAPKEIVILRTEIVGRGPKVKS